MSYANNVHAPAANTIATLTLVATAGRYREIKEGVIVGYDATPTGGLLTMQDGVAGDIVLAVPITSAGPAPIKFPFASTVGNALVVTLTAGGAGVKGYLTLVGRDGLA